MVWWNPGTWGKPKNKIKITIPQKATITKPSGEVITAEVINGKTKVTSSGGGGGSGGGRGSGGGSSNAAAEKAAAQEAARKAEEARKAEHQRLLKERKDRAIEGSKPLTVPSDFVGPLRPGVTREDVLYQGGADKLNETHIEYINKKAESAMEGNLKIVQDRINSGEITYEEGVAKLKRDSDVVNHYYNTKIKGYISKVQSKVKSPYFEKRQTGTFKGIPEFTTFYIDPETGKKRKITTAEAKKYKLAEFEIKDLQAKTDAQLQEEAGWLGKFTTPLQRAKFKGATSTALTPVKTSIKSYKEVEKSTSDWLYDVSGFTPEKHERQMKRIEESTQFLKDKGMAGWLAEAGGSIARGTGKLGKKTIDKPIKTMAIYGTTAAVFPTLAISDIAAPEAIEYGLKKTKQGVSKVDVFGLPVGKSISSLLPSTGEGLMVDALVMKGFGKAIVKSPKIVKKTFTRGLATKGGYGLAFGDTPEKRAMGLTELSMGVGFEFGEYAGRRLRLKWDKNQVIKYSVEERTKFETAKTNKIKYEMKPRPLAEQNKLKRYVKEAKDLWKYKPEVKELNLQGMDRISQKAVKPTNDWLKANKGKLIVGGTAGTRTQVINPDTYVPHDMDIFTLRGKPENYAKSLYNAFQKAGVKGYELRGSKLYHISTGKEAIEFHAYDDFLKANIEQVAPWYQTSKAGITKTPSGIKVLSMRSQVGQKTLGYARSGEARLKDWLYVSKEAKPAQLKAKAAYESAKLPEAYNFKQLLTGTVPIKTKPIKGTPAYEAFDFGFDFGFTPKKVTVKTYAKKTYPKYTSFDNMLYTPYKKPPAYQPYKGYKPIKTKYKAYKKSPYSPMLSYLAAPYSPYPVTLKYKPYKRTPYKGYTPTKTTKIPDRKIIDPFENLIGAPPIVPRSKTKLKKKVIKKKKGKKKYVARITGFEAAIGGGYRLVEAGKKFTGFETVRGKKVRQPIKKKKVVKRKEIKNNWGLY